jgi:hypothetical protein
MQELDNHGGLGTSGCYHRVDKSQNKNSNKAGIEETEYVGEHQEVHIRSCMETVRLLKGRYGDWGVAVMKTWPSKKLDTAYRWMTRCAVPVMCKGPGRGNGPRKAPKGRKPRKPLVKTIGCGKLASFFIWVYSYKEGS